MVSPYYQNQVSHPYKTTDKIMVLYIFFFTFLDNTPEDKDRNCYANLICLDLRRDDKFSERNGGIQPDFNIFFKEV
jgi:hypothetical protein